MSKSCSGLLDAFVACVERSACVAAAGRGVKECAADAAAAPECTQAREVRAPPERRRARARARARGATTRATALRARAPQQQRRASWRLAGARMVHAVAGWARPSDRAAAAPPPPRQLYFQCKRGMVDMRTRIRGNKGY
jgi:hypothetical protein